MQVTAVRLIEPLLLFLCRSSTVDLIVTNDLLRLCGDPGCNLKRPFNSFPDPRAPYELTFLSSSTGHSDLKLFYTQNIIIDHPRSSVVRTTGIQFRWRRSTLSTCMYVCNAITLESLHVGSSFSLIR